MSIGTCRNCAAEHQELRGGLCPGCRTRAAPEVETVTATGEELNARRLVGDYELVEEIARGGMGVVYKARQISLNRLVAVKMILKGELASEVEVHRFHREAEAAANLDHPNIVAIYEVGRHETLPYFSMRLVDGLSLNNQIERFTRDVRAAAGLMAIVARAVHHAHQRGVLHRDIKPGNILIDSQGAPHVTDFGLAKRVDVPSDLTRSEGIMGTPSYMSPEQAQEHSQLLTTATDVWSLGAVLYRLITGEPPFPGESAWEILNAILALEPVRPRLVNSQVDTDLETICLKCLEKDPERRYASAAAVADELERWVRHEPIQAKPSTYRDRALKWCRRKPLIAGLVGALCFVALLGLIGILWQWQEARDNAARAQKALAEAYVAQAQFRRMSGAAGQRMESMRALRAARSDYPNTAFLRDQVIATLALPDLVERPLGRLAAGRGHAFEINLETGVVAEAEADGGVSLRSLPDGRLLQSLPAPGAEVGKLRFGPGGQVLLVEYGDDARRWLAVWAWREARQLFTADHGIHGEAIDFSSDGLRVAIGQPDGRLRVYAVAGGEVERELILRLPSGLPRAAQAVRFDPTGRRLAECCLDDSHVQVWALEGADQVARFFHPDVVYDLAWAPDGEWLAAACRDANLYLWTPSRGTSRPRKLGGHEQAVVAVAFNRSGTLMATLGLDDTVRLWVPATKRQLVCRLDGENLRRLQFAGPAQQLMASSPRQQQCRLWETFGQEYVALEGGGSLANPVNTLAFSPDSRLLAVASGERALIWETSSGRKLMSASWPNANAAAFSADGLCLLASTEKGLLGYPVPPLLPGSEARSVELWGHAGDELGTMSVTPDHTLAAIAHQHEILLVPLDSGTNASVRVLPVRDFYHHLSLHPEGRWVAGIVHNTRVIDIWNVPAGEKTPSYATVRSSEYFQFSPDGRWLVVCWQGDYEFYRVGVWGRPEFVIPRKTASDQHAPLAFTRDGEVAALAATRYTIQLFRLPQAAPVQPGLIATLDAPDRQPLESLAFSPDGRRLAAATQDQTIQVWDLDRLGRHLSEMQLDEDWLNFPEPVMQPERSANASQQTL